MRRPAVAAALVAVTAVMALMLGVLGAAGPAQADAPPPKRIVSGWLPYWVTSPAHPAGINSAVQNADLLAEVSPFWFAATAKSGGGVKVGFNRNFGNATANSAWAMQQLKAAGLRVVPSVVDASGKGRMAATLADPARRAAHIADLVNLAVANGYDGIDLDYEGFAFSDGSSSWAATQPNWTAFVTELAAALHAQGKVLTVTIPPPCSTGGTCGPQAGYWVYNMTGIAPAVDRIRIMAYDYSVHGIGPIAPMPWVRTIVQYSAASMDPSKLEIGVPTYGRAWTLKNGSGYKLVGTCPSSGTSAYRSLTSMSSVTDADIPGILAANGIAPEQVQWDEVKQENWVNYDKKVTWTDSSGASQVCTAKRIMWWVGPQAVLARTQLVGEFGLAAASLWTIGGEDPAQWPLLRAYAQSLNPATTDVAISGPPAAIAGTPIQVAMQAASGGVPLAGITALLQFRPVGAKAWTDVQSLPTDANGAAVFTVTPTSNGTYQVVVPPADNRLEGVSVPYAISVQSQVNALPKQVRIPRGGKLVVKAVLVPGIDGQRIALQLHKGEKWKNVATGSVNAKGRGRLTADVPDAKGKYEYRVVAVGTKAILANASNVIPIRVTR